MAYALLLTEPDKAYIAGFLDGEGCITISKHHKGKAIRAQVTLNNSNLKVMQWIHTKLKLETTICVYDTIPGENKKIRYLINISKKSVVQEILEMLVPFLIVKKENAFLILEFLELSTSYKGMRNYSLTPRQVEIHNRIIELNKKGVM